MKRESASDDGTNKRQLKQVTERGIEEKGFQEKNARCNFDCLCGLIESEGWTASDID